VLNLTANANLTGILTLQVPEGNLTIIDTDESTKESPAIIGIISPSVVIALLIIALESEAKIMALMKHDRIVEFIGISAYFFTTLDLEVDTFSSVMELMPLGSLR
jgi:hypothetical protein